jgi:neutral ceramidase
MDSEFLELKHGIIKMAMYRLILIFVILSMGNLLFGQQISSSHNFRAAVVKVDITPDTPQMLAGYPERKSNGVHDHIFHRIIALDDGTTQFFMVSTDNCKMSPAEYDKVAEMLQKQFGINRQNFWWSVTHTHSAPELGTPGLSIIFLPERYKHPLPDDYTAFVEKKLIEGIAEARQKLIPARMGIGWGFSKANINRRAVDLDGKATIGMNPDGAVDHRIGLIRIDKLDGSPIALIANYPIHGTDLGPQNLKISGDVPGIVSEYVEQKIGAPVLFMNGAAGNLAPIYSVYPTPGAGHLGQFRILLGDKIIEANKMISSTTEKVSLSTGILTIETPRKAMEWPEELSNYTRTTSTGVKMVRLPVRFLKINEDIAIWSAPLELFCEISNEVRDRSPFPYTFYYGYTCGNLGYMLTPEEWPKGGYEPTVSPFTPEAPLELKESVVNYLKGEMLSHKSTSK